MRRCLRGALLLAAAVATRVQAEGLEQASIVVEGFPGSAKLALANGAPILLEDLEVGSVVRCYKPAVRAVGACQVATFAHAAPERSIALVQLGLDDGAFVSVAGTQFLWVIRSPVAPPLAAGAAAYGTGLPFGEYVHASAIRPGDSVISLVAGNARLSLRMVASTANLVGEGAYSPVLALGGLPVVDGAVASSFAGSGNPVTAYERFMLDRGDVADAQELGVAARDLQAALPGAFKEGENVAAGDGRMGTDLGALWVRADHAIRKQA